MKEYIKSIIDNMLNFIECDEDSYYLESHVIECEFHLSIFVRQFETSTINQNMAISYVKKLVTDLNDLNERCEHFLIEPAQREAICELIHSVLILK